MWDAAALSDRLIQLVVRVLYDLDDRYAPGLHLPATLGGHRVGADAHADLIYTLGLLGEAGVDSVANQPIESVLRQRLAEVDGPGTHTFFSYRIAETVQRLGGLDAVRTEHRAAVEQACDSTEWIPLLDQQLLPRNYAVVLARCESARQALGLDVDTATLDDLISRTRTLLGENPDGWLDDSHDGRGQIDMYTVDAYLFAEPLADRLGAVWDRGFRSAAHLVSAVAAPDGSAITWGRSIGVLALCHSIELASLLSQRGLADAWWFELAERATDNIAGWFDDGLVVSHKHRATFAYRGPERRLQLGLDCLGKLATAALTLRSGTVYPRPDADIRCQNEWVAFGEGLGAWARRDPRLSFVLPVVGGPGADYAPSPRLPSVFEVPTDSPLVCGLPVAWRHERRFAPAGRATHIRHQSDQLTITHDGFASTDAGLGETPRILDAQRHATYRVDGRRLIVDEQLSFPDKLPHALAILIPETIGQPLHVEANGDGVRRVAEVDTNGLAEWRSMYGELPRMYEIEVTPAPRLSLRWSVQPKLRVMSTAAHHWYHRCLYGPLESRVAARQVPFHLLGDLARLREALRDVDVFHLHWPEWFTGDDPDRAAAVAATIKDCGIPVVWTQHNLVPHAATDASALYEVWAEAADGIIHHSEWGQQTVTNRYRFRQDAQHRVIPHGHWGPLMDGFATIDRHEAESALGLCPCRRRIGIVGAPRNGKDTQLLIDGFAASSRDDMQLLVLCHDGETIPDDPRITALAYVEVPRDEYDRRLATIDILAMPLSPGASYLTSGQPADAVAAGIPALVSSWPYLHETLGDAAIAYGTTAAELARTLDDLDDSTIERAATASRALQAPFDWHNLAEPTWQLLDEVAAGSFRACT